MNIFSLHGKYFRNDENRLTANVLFLLAESRQAFLNAFMVAIGVRLQPSELSRAEVVFQSRAQMPTGVDIPDGEIRVGDAVHVLIEAKIGTNRLSVSQIRRYAERLSVSCARRRRLVCLTQINEEESFNRIRHEIESGILPKGSCKWMPWHRVLRILRQATGSEAGVLQKTERAVRAGRKPDHTQRMAALFLEEVESTMYIRKDIDEMARGELDDVVVHTQQPWFMEAARRHRLWFPSGALRYGPRPAQYVAYYETGSAQNENPKSIAYIARNLTSWSRITANDAKEIPAFQALLKDKKLRHEIDSWDLDKGGTFHLCLTDAPIKLKRPIPLKTPSYARVLTKRRYDLPAILNAVTVDDLF